MGLCLQLFTPSIAAHPDCVLQLAFDRWNSTLEPPAAHRDWYDRTFNFTWGRGGSQLDFVLKGGDFIGEFADEASRTGQKPFVTIRLNDGQMCSHPPTPDNDSSLINNDHQVSLMTCALPPYRGQAWYSLCALLCAMHGHEHMCGHPCTYAVFDLYSRVCARTMWEGIGL